MTARHLLIIVGFSLILFTRPRFCSVTGAAGKGPLNNPTSREKSDAKAEADRIRKERQSQARSLLISLASDARSFRDQTVRSLSMLLSFLGLIFVGDAMHSQAQANRHSDYQLLVKSLQGDTAAVRSLLQRGADPNTPPGPNDRGMTALMFASRIGDSQTVRLLTEAGADINAKSNSGANASNERSHEW
jgi:ankyrin repeat protein